MPFPVRAIQVDGCSEFQASFKMEYQRRGILLFALPPRSTKLMGRVERAQRTHTEEFYQVTEFSLEVAPSNRELRDWDHTYEPVRPHEALGYATPREFIPRWQSQGEGA